MPRNPRVVIPDVAHHVTQRGNNRQPVFFSHGDYRYYLELLARHASRAGVHVLGYCLMTNHVHMVVVPESEGSLAHLFCRIHSEYAQAVNRNRERSGHLWQSRFYSCPLDEGHLIRTLRYVDLNPVRAGLAAQAGEWPWSSARAHLDEPGDPILDSNWHCWLRSWDLGEWRELLANAPDDECDLVRQATRAGRPLGSEGFVARLEELAGRRLTPRPRGRPFKE